MVLRPSACSGEKGDLRIARERVPERQRPLGGELADQTLGQWLDAFIVIRRLGSAGGGIAPDPDDDRVRPGAGGRAGIGDDTGLRLLFAFRPRFVLRLHIAALDAQGAIVGEADEGPGSRNVGRVIDLGLLGAGLEHGLHLI